MKTTPHQEVSPLVLIVDDDKFMRMQLRCFLEEEGYLVVETSDGEQALTAYQYLHPDVVLLDAVMPVMDGFTCCTQLRALAQGDHIPILMITALDDQDSVDQGFEAGATDFITKPIHWAVLRQRVYRLLQASRATEELRQQTERERLMSVITQHIRQSLNLEEILNTTVSEVRKFLQTDRVVIYRFEPDWSGVVVVESVDKQWIPILGTTIYDPCFAKTYVQQYREGRIRVMEDIHTAGLDPYHINLLAQRQVRANLVVPILQNEQTQNSSKKGGKIPNRLWGLLIAHHCSAPRHWEQLEVDFLCALATQAAIAIQQSELYQKIQQLNTNLENQVQERTAQLQQALDFEATLKRIADKVRDSLDETQILQSAVQELAQVLGVDYCGTALYNLSQSTSTICYEYTASMPASQGRVVKMADAPGIYTQLLQGQYLQFCRIISNPIQPVYTQVAALACPIFDNEGVLGDLWIFNQKDYVFNELEMRLVQQVANQCAIAIRQARLYQASLAQVRELEKLNQLKDDFLCTVSHELRTPVSNMKMAIQLLEATIDPGSTVLLERTTPHPESSPAAARYLHLLHEECDRELKLINDLLDLQHLNAGSQPLESTIIHLQDWIPYVVEPFEQRVQDSQQLLQIEVAPEVPTITSDPYILERILTELLNNACKYTPATETIQVTAQTKSNVIQLSVCNSGVEIPACEIPRIFDRFYRIPSHDPWKHGGTGLGLALVQKLVAYIGGCIQVKSLAQNTCFLVELPINSAEKKFCSVVSSELNTA